MKRRCANPNCPTPFYELDAAHRYGDYCSKECAREMTGKPTGNTQVFICRNVGFTSPPKPNRFHGTDRKVQS